MLSSLVVNVNKAFPALGGLSTCSANFVFVFVPVRARNRMHSITCRQLV